MALIRINKPQPSLEFVAKQWRDSELTRTDSLVDLSDYPYKEAMVTYRQVLRDWTDSEDFPAVRPEMTVEAVQPEEPTESTEE